MAQQMDPTSVRKTINVDAAQELAWRVFTEKMGTWWPLAYYKIGKATAVDAVIEPHVGGRWYERGDDGSMCQCGSVLAWEPPSRLVLSWDINADWQYALNWSIVILIALGRAAMRCAGSSTPKEIGAASWWRSLGPPRHNEDIPCRISEGREMH